MVQFYKPNDLLILYITNIKNCSLSIVLTVPDQKLQKALNITHYHIASMSTWRFHDIITYFQIFKENVRWWGRRMLDGHAESAVKVSVAIQYSVVVARNGYIRNVVV